MGPCLGVLFSLRLWALMYFALAVEENSPILIAKVSCWVWASTTRSWINFGLMELKREEREIKSK